MTTTPAPLPAMASAHPASPRLDYLDATRAFALVLGVVFHASLSYLPFYIGWAVQDVSTNIVTGGFATISHSFRLVVFFLLAGFFTHLTLRRKGVTDLLKSRVIRIAIPFVVGWFLLRPLIISGWIMGFSSMQGELQFWSGIAAGFDELKKLPQGLFVGTHLWFLYYLALITGIALLVRAALGVWSPAAAAVSAALDRFVSWWSGSRWGLLLGVIFIAPVLSIMDGWGVDTPDKSLVPHIPALLLYGGFFALGWFLDRKPEGLDRFSQLTWFRGAVALAAIAVTLLLTGIQMDPGHPQHELAHRVYNVSYAAMMWTLVWLTIGLFRRFCKRPRRWIRYVADSSYWMYLIHLPIVLWLQVATAEIELPWLLKLAFVATASIGICLITYDLFVRSTFIGQLLNGRKRDRVIFAR